MSTLQKSVLVIILLLLVFTATISVLSKPSFTETPKSGSKQSFLYNSDSDLDLLLSTLESINLRMATLENEQHKMALKIKSVTQAQNQLINSVSNEKFDAKKLELELELEQEQEQEQEQELIHSVEEMKQQKIENFSSYYNSEEYDTDWTLTTYEVVTQSMERLALSNSQLDSVDCRSTLCRMELSHDDDQSLQNFRGQVGMLFAYPVDGMIYSVDNGTETPGTVVYFTREGHDLPEIADY